MDIFKIVDDKFIKLTPEEVSENQTLIDSGNIRQKNGKLILQTPEEIQKDIEDKQPTKEQQRQILKQKLHEDMSKTVVELNGKTFWADPQSEQNFSGRLREMEISGNAKTKWVQGLDIFKATKEELTTVVIEGTKKNAALWDAYIEAVEAL